MTSTWRTEEFVAHALLSGPDDGAPWAWERWRGIERALSPVVGWARGRPGVEVLQTRRVEPGSRVLGKDVLKFGRLSWGPTGSVKWAHDSPETRDRSPGWRFVDLTVWAPSRATCGKEDRPPTVWINLRPGVTGLFASKLIVVVSESVASLADPPLDDHIRQAGRVLGAQLWAATRRPFDVAGPSGESLSFNFHTAGPLRRGPHRQLSPEMLADGWSVIE